MKVGSKVRFKTSSLDPHFAADAFLLEFSKGAPFIHATLVEKDVFDHYVILEIEGLKEYVHWSHLFNSKKNQFFEQDIMNGLFVEGRCLFDCRFIEPDE